MTGPSGRPPRGRRNNGLDAREFIALGDLDPRVGEHLLDVLAVAGIAAFLQPSADFNPIIRSTVLPSRPTDQLWVDRDHVEDARALIEQVESEAATDAAREAGRARRTGPPDEQARAQNLADRDPADRDPADLDAADREQDTALDVDAAWQEIVAGFDAPAGDAPSWPAIENTSTTNPTGPTSSLGAAITRADHLNPLGQSAGPRDHSLAEPSDDDLLDSDDEGYEPPMPPPMPRPSTHAVLAVLAVLVGFVLFFQPELLPISASASMVLGVLGVLGGAGMLVYRLRDGFSSDDPDDGAVV